jgi:TRAF-interacting protein
MWKHYNLTHVSLALHIHHADEKTSCHQQPDDDFQTPKFLGSDGTRKSISKWCKGSMTAGSATANTNRGNLVAVGHDGRGGKVKFLRDLGRFQVSSTSSSHLILCQTTQITRFLTIHHSIFLLQDSNSPALWPKASKVGGKCGQSQIDHFFGKR